MVRNAVSRWAPSVLPLAVLLLLAIATRPAHADVIGIGDVLPAIDDPENPGTQIPNLPIGGGNVADTIVVGGTGQMIGDTDTGLMIIDIPAFTAPLTSPGGIIGGTPDGAGVVQIFSLGSIWRVSNALVVGAFGQGTLELINGGQLSENPNSPAAPTLEVFVGEGFGSQGFVNLRGNGSLLRSNRLVIGGAGFGQMSMTTRARTTTVSEAIIGELGTGNDIGVGFVSVDGQLTRWTIGSTAGS
ncbi:MAG TPA: hypothetical protein PKC18_01805, partial [Lacipirellulaceae bacterium]|nr:hypothetical protein [Lacipirellulaceae bacterium]